VQYGILGSLVVLEGGREVPIGAAKQRALLTVLLLRRGKVVPTDTLIDELWGERPPATAVKAIQTYVSQLRKTLGEDSLQTMPRGYALRLEPDALDADRFESLLNRGRTLVGENEAGEARQILREALGLWRGPALADFRDERFAHDESARLEELRLIALELRLEAELALGRHADAVPELEALVREHPLRERLRGLLMLALYRAERQADALAAYRQARTALVEELGLVPSDHLQELEKAILRHDPELDLPSAPAQLRAGATTGPHPEQAAGAPPRVPAAPAAGARVRGRRIAVALTGLAAAATAGVLLLDRGGSSRALPDLRTFASAGGDAVAAVDASSGHISAATILGAAPSSIAYGAGSIWVTLPDENSLVRIDPASNTVQQTIPVGNGPAAIAVGGGFVWVANSLEGSVSQIDPRTDGGKEVARIPVGNGPGGLSYGLGAIWVADSLDRTVVRIDPVTGKAGRPIPVGSGADAIAAGDGAIWVAGESAGVVTRIDPGATNLVRPINVGSDPVALAAAPGAVWVVDNADSTVSRIDPATDRVRAAIPVGEGPNGIAIAPNGAVWVSNDLAGTLSRVDSSLDRVVKTVPVGDLPQGVAVNGSITYAAVQTTGSAHRGGTLTLAVANPATYIAPIPRSLDPGKGYTDWTLLSLTNDGLLGYGRSTSIDIYKVVPDLAVALPTVGDGGRSYTFQLRPGVRYSTGAPVRLADVRRGIERTLQLSKGEIPGSYLDGIVGASACTKAKSSCDLSQGITTNPESNTITFHLRAPDSDFLYKLALPIADAVPAGTPVAAHLPLPATGPYEVASWDVKRSEVTLVRNPSFHLWSTAAQPDGFPDRIVERFGYTGDSAVSAVERGTADITADGPDQTWSPALTSTLEKRFSSRLHSTPTPSVFAVWLNTRVPPFDDVAVRRALDYAVDRNHLVALNDGPAVSQATCQILPPNVNGYRPYCPYTIAPDSAGTYTGPDLARARRLVAASGTKGEAVTVWFPNIPVGRRNGGYFVSVLRSLGYKAKLRLVPQSGRGWASHHQAGAGGWFPDFPSANDFFTPLFTCSSYQPDKPQRNLNFPGICDHRLDAKIARASALQSADPSASAALWATIDDELTDDAVWVPVHNYIWTDFVASRVGNYTPCYLDAFAGAVGACLDRLWVR
jgi:YVTN family beta-propeller protein